MNGRIQFNFQENAVFFFPEVMKHSAGSKVEKKTIRTLQFYMQQSNFNPPAFYAITVRVAVSLNTFAALHLQYN